MSKIDELIVEKCPNGVKFLKLETICTSINAGGDLPKNFLKGQKEPTLQYPYPIFSNGTDNKALYGYTDEYRVGQEAVTISARGTIGYHTVRDPKFTPIVRLIILIPNTEMVTSKFLDYVLDITEIGHSGGSIPQLTVPNVKKIKIPVPPIEVQKEIVNILDNFTQLEAELSAELSARRRQHAHYWDYLLAPRETWKTITLGGIADVFDGPHATPKKTITGPWYLSISSLKNGRVDLTESAHLGDDEYPTWVRRVAPRVGDTLFSYETRVGQAAYWDTNEPAALGRRMGLLRPNINLVHPRFLTLLYLGPQFQKLILAKTVKGSTVDRIPIANMASWEVTIPSLDEQAKIVRQVDAFDALVNDLNIGLPAELSARRKQYEYYRTKLLTFQELTA